MLVTKDRRAFLAGVGRSLAGASATPFVAVAPLRAATASGADERAGWVALARRLADPVLTHLAAGTLRARMPVEEQEGAGRASVTHLEALGRLLAGLAPWLELGESGDEEGALRAHYGELARRAIASATDPDSPDFLNFTSGGQPLVDAAFLAQAVLRAPRVLGQGLSSSARENLVRALESTRGIVPPFNNWLLFSAMVEAGLARLGASWDRVRVDYALRQHAQWYRGDGIYGDGADVHADYYNSFVIHPMLLDVLETCGAESPAWRAMKEPVRLRARRYAALLERSISPEGTYPPVGRSLAYRFGAFHLLAQMALRRDLPDGVSPGQVRAALSAVIRRQAEAPGTFDAEGWLRIGFCGHQPGTGERYISTGSLYLCAVGLLPLGLSPVDPFWSAPAGTWTSRRAWAGEPFPPDAALEKPG